MELKWFLHKYYINLLKGFARISQGYLTGNYVAQP